jgi:hypothetical protein
VNIRSGGLILSIIGLCGFGYINNILGHRLVLEVPYTKFDTSDISDLRFYNDNIFNVNSCKNTPIFQTVKAKKEFIKQCTASRPQIYEELEQLSDSFWMQHCSEQLLLIAQMLEKLPVIEEVNQSINITNSDQKDQTGNIKSKGDQVRNNKTYTLDCLRFSVALAGLKSSNQLGTVQVTQSKVKQIQSKYTTLIDQMGPEFDKQLAAFEQVGYHPISENIQSSSSYLNQIKIGDVVYFIPIQDGFTNRQEYLDHRYSIQKLALLENLKQLLLDKNVISLDLLQGSNIDKVLQELYGDQQILMELLNPAELISLRDLLESELSMLKSQKTSISELNSRIKQLQISTDKTNAKIKKFQESRSKQTSYGKVNLEAANYHYITVIDKTAESIKAIQIDGANPLIPMSIENIESIVGRSEKIVILRKR